VSISGVLPGESFTDVRQFLLNVPATVPATSVTWYVDDVSVSQSSSPPFVFAYDPASFDGGDHVVRAVVDVGGAPIEAAVEFESSVPATEGGGGGVPMFVVIGGVVILLLAGGGGVFFMRVRSMGHDAVPIPADQRMTPWVTQVANARRASLAELATEPAAEITPEDIGKPLGFLISRSGPDLGQEYAVGGKPVSIGTGAACGVRVSDPSLNLEEARIWVRGGHLMVHKITRLSDVESDGSGGGWAILDPGDSFEIHEHVFEFRLLPAEQPAAEATATPDILREAPRRDAEPSSPRLTELMPRDGGFTHGAESPAR
jgi:hypothetical protein